MHQKKDYHAISKQKAKHIVTKIKCTNIYLLL